LRVLEKANLKVSSSLKELERVLSCFDRVNKFAIEQKIRDECRLALAEGFTNAVRHAHHNLPTEVPIEIEIAILEQSLELRIWDYGPPNFDLQAYIKNLPLRQKQNHRLDTNGRGIPILLKIADRLSYFRTEDGRNCLLIVRNYLPHET
jgi:serine/threonine-protein kinase RsbW